MSNLVHDDQTPFSFLVVDPEQHQSFRNGERDPLNHDLIEVGRTDSGEPAVAMYINPLKLDKLTLKKLRMCAVEMGLDVKIIDGVVSEMCSSKVADDLTPLQMACQRGDEAAARLLGEEERPPASTSAQRPSSPSSSSLLPSLEVARPSTDATVRQ